MSRSLGDIQKGMLIVTMVIILICLSGCGPHEPINFKLYSGHSGQQRPKEQIAIVTNKPPYKSSGGVHIMAVDGRRFKQPTGPRYVISPIEVELELEPGIHLFTVQYHYYSYGYSDMYYSIPTTEVRGEHELAVEFFTKPGHSYNIEANISPGTRNAGRASQASWRPVVTDISSEEPVNARVLSAEITGLIRSINELYKNANYPKALLHCEQAIKLDPYEPYLWLKKAYIMRKQNRGKKALESFNRCLEIAHRFHKATMEKGYLLLYLKRNQEAIACAERLLKYNAYPYDVWMIKGQVLHNNGSYIERLLQNE